MIRDYRDVEGGVRIIYDYERTMPHNLGDKKIVLVVERPLYSVWS